MACRWNEKIHALHDGELPADERESVAAHAAVCGECAQELRSIERMARFLSGAPMPGINELTMARVGEKIRLEKLNGRRTVRLAGWLTAAAALVMAACSAGLYSINEKAAQPPVAGAEMWEQVATTLELPASSETDDPTKLILDGDE